MMTITSITYFNGFVAKIGDDNYRRLFGWFCSEEGDINNVIVFFYGDGVVKKAVATYGFFWSFWFNSLEIFFDQKVASCARAKT